MTQTQTRSRAQKQFDENKPIEGESFTDGDGHKHTVITALELAMKAALGDEYERMNDEQRRAAWLEFTKEATKEVRRVSREAERGESDSTAIDLIRNASIAAIREANAKLAPHNRHVGTVTLRFSVDPETGNITSASKPAEPIKIKRGKIANLGVSESSDEQNPNGEGAATNDSETPPPTE